MESGRRICSGGPGDVPRRLQRSRAGDPTILIERSVTHHFEILRAMRRGQVGTRLIKRIGQADTFNGLLADSVDHGGFRDAGDLEDRRHDVDHVMELVAYSTRVFDMARPCYGHSLARAA